VHYGLRWENLQECNCSVALGLELNVSVRPYIKQIHSETYDKLPVHVDPAMKSPFL